MTITPETEAYLAGAGTPIQQALFQRASDEIQAAYTRENPDEPEDMAGMIADELVGASMYVLGDTDLKTLAEQALQAKIAASAAMEQLGGAMIAADLQGLSISEIAEQTSLTRRSVYKRMHR